MSGPPQPHDRIESTGTGTGGSSFIPALLWLKCTDANVFKFPTPEPSGPGPQPNPSRDSFELPAASGCSTATRFVQWPLGRWDGWDEWDEWDDFPSLLLLLLGFLGFLGFILDLYWNEFKKWSLGHWFGSPLRAAMGGDLLPASGMR